MASAAVTLSSPFKICYVHNNPRKIAAESSDPNVTPYLSLLGKALEQELNFRGCAQPSEYQCPDVRGQIIPSIEPGTITSGMRDGSAHVLRCLKVWYDLPSDVFFSAVSSMDRFLTKMKAQPKHLSCIAVSAFHLACTHYKEKGLITTIPDPNDIVSISQSRCSSSDLLRMQDILADKLGLNKPMEAKNVTPLTLLRIMFDLSRAASKRLVLHDPLPDQLPDHLVYQLEILACDSLLLQYKPSEVALALLTTDFQRHVAKSNNASQLSSTLMSIVGELQKYCNTSASSFVQCLKIVICQLEKYNGDGTVAHRQRLVWKLSNRTLRHLRPTDKLRATLPTILETTKMKRLRSNSECSDESMESSSSESDSERDLEIDDS